MVNSDWYMDQGIKIEWDGKYILNHELDVHFRIHKTLILKLPKK